MFLCAPAIGTYGHDGVVGGFRLPALFSFGHYCNVPSVYTILSMIPQNRSDR